MGAHAGPADWWTDNTDDGRTHVATKGVVQSGLVLNLDAGVSQSYPGTGTTWSDLSGNGYNGSTNGTVSYSSGALSLGTTGNTTNWLSFPTTPINGLTAWTFEFVIQRDVTNTLDPIISCGSDNQGLLAFVNSDLNLYNTTNTSIACSLPSNGTPFCLTATSASGSWEAFINGESQGTNTVTTSTITTSTAIGIVLGQELDTTTGGFVTTQSFLGRYYAVRIYNRVLTDSEIKQNFNATRGRYGI